MYLIKKEYNPYLHKNDSTQRVMADVILALMPVAVMMWVGYGFTPLMVVLVAIGSALLTEFLFNALLRRDTRSLGDGSSIVTGLLLACTIGPFTPLPIVAVGGITAVLFGKMLWGGLGKNCFNPALFGRECMVVLFPAIMNSGEIFTNTASLHMRELTLFQNEFWDHLLFRPVGAIGEYSPLLLIVGGFYLLARRRISWHIPMGLLTVFALLLFIFREHALGFTIGGLFLGTLYMATDMPTSSSTHAGKIYFGVMIAICAFICLWFGIIRGYFSYAILLMNAFVVPINWVFRPRTWGREAGVSTRIWQAALLTIIILIVLAGIIWIHKADLMLYPMIALVLYSLVRFKFSE
ncbi:MAG: RnfABCDGE type electron transport complex subunit D [Bacteroides sp.]|nr:RnfABCDGE type electron transport complex subunit D [Bacteroides sp.]